MSGLGFLSQINRTNNAVQTSMQRIATGSRQPSAAYNPSGYAIAVRMRSNIGTAAQSQRNVQTANAMLNVAAGGVSSTVDALSTLRDRLVQAANGTNQPSDIAAIEKEVSQTIATVNDNANVEFNGMKLLNGSRSMTIAGDTGDKTIRFADLSAQGLGLVDKDGNSTLDLSSKEGLEAALGTVDAAIGKARDGLVDMALDATLGMATDIGAMQQNFSFADANYTTMGEGLSGALSAQDDTDIAAEVTKLRSADTQQQMAMFAQKMFMHNRANVLSLLP